MTQTLKTTVAATAQRVAVRRATGFTLSEILLALGIFAIGMAAVSSLFPVAALLQRETANDVQVDHLSESLRAIIESQVFVYDKTFPSTPANDTLNSAYYPSAITPGKSELENITTRFFPFPQTYYPTFQVKPDDGSGADLTEHCDYIWFAYVQDLNADPLNPNWVVRVVVLDAEAGGVGRINSVQILAGNEGFSVSQSDDYFDAGDTIMDDYGGIYTVQQVEENGGNLELYTDRLVSTDLGTPGRLYHARRSERDNRTQVRGFFTFAITATQPD